MYILFSYENVIQTWPALNHPMKKLIFIILLLTFSINAQEVIEIVDSEKLKNSFVSKIVSTKNISKAEKLAKKDIKKNLLFLIVPGGIAPAIYDSDFGFNQNYGVSFINFGCEPINENIASAYNVKVFNFLTEQYGLNWLKVARTDAFGLKEYREQR